MAPAPGSPPRASLEGIPPELRNNIYLKVAEEIDEASIIGRKIDRFDPTWTDAEAEDRMWHALAKHPLSQTCRKIRTEFSPIHRHYAITKGVPKYYLELENYDMDRMEKLAFLVARVGPLLEHLKLTAEKFVIRFLLNGHAVKSVKLLANYARTPHRLGRGYYRLKSLFPPDREYWSWEVVLNLYDNSMSTAQKAVATSHKQEAYIRYLLKNMYEGPMYGDLSQFPRATSNQDLVRSYSNDAQTRRVTTLLREYHDKANAGFQAAKREMHRIKVENDTRQKLREELRATMRKELILELRTELEGVFNEMFQEKLKQKIKDEVKQEVKDEVKRDLIAQMQALLM